MDDQPSPAVATKASTSTDKPEQLSEVEASAKGDDALFGTLWPLGTQVRLDPTVDRKRFREQRNRLKALGYTFDAIEQIWSNAGSNS